MKITYPHTIENCVGEKIIFHSLQQEPDGARVIVENFVNPLCGPPIHTHFLQDECLTVVKGKITKPGLSHSAISSLILKIIPKMIRASTYSNTNTHPQSNLFWLYESSS